MGFKGSVLGTIITGAGHGLKPLVLQLASSHKSIYSAMSFWYLMGMGYGFHAIGSPVDAISISNRLVLPTSMEDLDVMLLNLCSRKEESFASCGICVSCNIIDCLIDSVCSGWKIESSGMVGSSIRLFLMTSCDVPVLVHDILLTVVFSISTGFNVD